MSNRTDSFSKRLERSVKASAENATINATDYIVYGVVFAGIVWAFTQLKNGGRA